MDSGHHQVNVPPIGPSRMVGGPLQSQGSSGIFFQGDRQSQNMVNSQFVSSFENSIPGGARATLGLVSGDVNQGLLNNVGISGPSIGASSLVTDANSGFAGGPQVQRSASFNNESYMRLPASPMSFTSNTISVSGSSIIDGSQSVQQNTQHDPILQQPIQNHHQLQHGAPGLMSLHAAQSGQVSLPSGPSLASPVIQDLSNISESHKKPRLDTKQEGILQSQILQQVLQRNDMQLISNNSHYQAYLQHQQRLRQEQYALLQQKQHQQQLKNQLRPQGIQYNAPMKNPYESSGVCARRLMQYLYHRRQRGPEGTISYWRKLMKEYYAPGAKKRWCLSLYENVGQHALGAFPQTAMDVWHCDICGARSGRGFEATYEVLPRLAELKFSSGVLDEVLFLDWPRERRFSSGLMILEYEKAVEESVYEQLRVIREGQLRIIFTEDLKILSWEFCARHHEELLSRRMVAPQVSQLLQIVQKCQSTISDAGSDVAPSEDLQANNNMVVTAGRQLSKSLELQTLNELGFSKRYVRCLQIAEVVHHMKDLIDFCMESKLGPIESLKNFPRHASTSKNQLQKLQEVEQMTSMQGLLAGRHTPSKLMGKPSGTNNHFVTNNNMASRSSPSPSTAASMALTYYPKLMTPNGQDPFTTNANSLQQETSLSNSNRGRPGNTTPGSAHNLQSELSTPSLAAQPPFQFQHRSLLANSVSQQNQQTNPVLPPNNEIQQSQDMSNNSNGAAVQPKSLSVQNERGNSVSDDARAGNYTTGTMPAASNMGGGIGEPSLGKSNSFRAASNTGPSTADGQSCGMFSQNVSNLDQDLQLPDDITDQFIESGFFDDADMDFGWKV